MLCRFLVAMMLSGYVSGSAAEVTDAAIIALDAAALREEIAAERLTAERVTATYLRRIAELDAAGPELRAVIEVNPDALDIARDLDRRRSTTTPGPLFGVPVLLKANIDTGDRMATTAGSLALAQHRARADAPIVAHLRAAGAVVLGKTNLSEWANFRSRDSTSGWSSLGGQTKNPYVLDRNPCGSSSGSAVSVAARLAPLAVGTETDGSIVCPAAANGVVGIKPTHGTIDTGGVIPLAASQDTVGPLARSAGDAALLWSVLAGVDVADRAAVRQLRVGIVRDYDGAAADAAAASALGTAVSWLQAGGVQLVDPVAASPPPAVRVAEITILLAELRAGLDRYLSGVENGPRSLAELVEFNRAQSADVMPYFGQDRLIEALEHPGTEAPIYTVAQGVIAAERDRLLDLLAELRLDALIVPANSVAWRTDYAEGDRFMVSSSSIAAVSGFPALALPIALERGLPLGVSLVAAPGNEGVLFSLAAAIEARRGPFPEPRFLPETPGL